MSVYSFAFRGAMPLGNLAAGFLASLFSVPAVLVGNGVVMLCVGAFVLLRGRGGVTAL